ncbi:uncharacterized protein LOC113234608, partial [Hyposmocoma kahamanoa]|uniref:uncharacterized protein LOC113234608 n=1 Tax=Hyposmocoma kahamanoa TaxID=1477025 RepID=UPI000E6DA553
MVRHYKRKRETPYSRENLLKAVEEVKFKRMSSYQAAEQFGVPRATIYAHVSGTRGLNKPGRSTVFDKDTELRIVNCILVMEKCGFPLTRKEVISLISEFIRRNGIVTAFKNDIPGDDWFRNFRRRHNLSLKKPQSVEIARKKACNPFTVYEYFELLEKAIRDLDLSSAPDRIYNLDETSFCQDPSKSKVVGKVGHRCTRTTSSPGRTNTSVLLAANANGDKIPPLIIFQGKYLWNEWMYKNEKVKTAYAVSKKGWMETSIFEKYLKDVFVPAIGSKRPVLLIYDGHSTHTDLSVIEYAISEGITILKLPPHSSDVLQPLDCSVMKPMKDRWDQELIKWQRMHVGFKLPKSEFARILTGIWENLNPVIISNGFKKTGIYPVNRNMIGKENFDSLSWQRWETHIQSQLKTICTENKTVNDADTMEYNDFKSMIKDTDLENSIFNTIQEIPSLRDLALKISSQSINQCQKDNHDNSNKRDEHATGIDSNLSMNGKENEQQEKHLILDNQKAIANKELAKTKKWISDSEDTGSYESMDTSETEDLDTFMETILKDEELYKDEYHDDVIECLPVPIFDDKDMVYIFSRNVNIAEK